jgi:hypothetical protein
MTIFQMLKEMPRHMVETKAIYYFAAWTVLVLLVNHFI